MGAEEARTQSHERPSRVNVAHPIFCFQEYSELPRDLLPLVEQVRSSRLLSISRITRNQREEIQFESAPPTNVGGYYWLYTDYSLDELEQCTKSHLDGAIDIALMAKLHRGLGNVCTIQDGDFRVVYNGIANASMGLRKRLAQHFNGGDGTGALHIKHTNLHDLRRWRVSYASIDFKGNYEPDVDSDFAHAKHVERIWRLEHGWPLLCTQ